MKGSISRVCRSAVLPLLMGMGALYPTPLHAQTFYGSIVGTVTDTSGAIVPGATVTVTDKATAEKRIATSNAAGEYVFPDLVPAVYTVAVERANFKRYLRDTVTVEVNTTVRVDAPLQVGAVTETVEISSEAATLQTDSGTLRAEVEGQQVQEMPLNGRNAMNLLALTPGVIPTNALEQQTGMNQSGTGTNAGGWNGFTTNGGDNMEYFDGAPLNVLNASTGGEGLTLVPTQDAVQEFSVDTSANSADQGRTTGGNVNFTSRSGTNQLHASLYEYIRNRDFNANTYFGNLTGAARPEWTQNQYGANVGMPIKKDKVFFFGAWEAFKILTSVPTSTNVPTAAMLNGVFNGVGITGGARDFTDPTGNCTVAPIPSNGVTVNGTNYPQGPTGGYYISNLYGPGNVSGTCGDPTAQVMETYFPLPNSTQSGFNYFINGPDGETQNQLNARVDFNVSPKQRVFAHGIWWHIQDKPFMPFPTVTKWDMGQEAADFNNNTEILGDTYTLSPKTVLDVRATWLRFYFYAAGGPNNVNLSQFGTDWAPLQALVPAGNHWIPEPNISTGAHSFYNINNFEGMQQRYDTYGINGSLTHLAGRHSLKVGGEARLMDSENGDTQFNTGNTTFGINFTGSTSAGTGDEWAEFLFGFPKSGTFGGGYPTTVFNYYQGYYGQDSWQVSRKLTVNLGLRWELPGGIAEKKNSQTVLLPNAVDPYTDVQGTEALTASSLYQWRTIESVRHDLFAPRFGFAYRVDSNTVIRGGYGVTYESVDLDKSIGTAVVNSSTATFTNVTSPTTRLYDPFTTSEVTPPSHRSNPAFMETLMQNVAATGGYAPSANYPYIHFPYIQEWNFTVGRSVGKSFQAAVSYVGTHGVHLPAGGGVDEIPASNYTVTTSGTSQLAYATNGPYAGDQLVWKTGSTTAGNNGSGNFCTPNGAVCNSNWTVGHALQPYPYYNGFTIANLTYANQHYNGLQAQATERFGGAGSLGGAFTWAKTIGDNVNYQDYWNHRGDRAVQGVPMRFVTNYVLPIPLGKGQRFLNDGGAADKIVGGWAINGITTFQHGGYLTLTTSNTNLLNKDFGAGTTRPNYTAGCQKNLPGSATARRLEWFNTSCFSYPGDYTYGNEPANDPQMFGQGWDNWDLALLKSTKITEKATFQFRAETFNTFNRVQFSNPTTTQGSGSFGEVTSQANNPRLIQLSGRVSF